MTIIQPAENNRPDNKGLVLLIYPPTGLDLKGVSVFMPLSVIFLAESLNTAGFEARILDLRLIPDWKNSLRHWLAEKPLYVGISAMTGHQLAGGLAAARTIRRINPALPLVWGGIHPSILPEETLENEFVDLVVSGRGEEQAVRIAEEISKGIDPVGQIYSSPPEATGVGADRSFVKVNDQWRQYLTPVVHEVKGLAHVTSRGCPHRCGYCYNKAVNHANWAGDSADSVISYLEELGRLSVRGVIFFDDNFFVDRNRVQEIAEGILARKIRVSIKADCRADYLDRYDDSFLRLLKRAGFELLYIGAESGSDRVLKVINKDVDVATMAEANRRLARAGIKPHYSFMAGLPGERIEDMRATMRLILRLKQDHPGAYLSPVKAYVPYPGTDLFTTALDYGFTPPSTLEEWSKCNWGSRRRAWLSRKQALFVEKMAYVSLGLDTSSVDLSGMSQNRFATWGYLKFAGLCRRRCSKKNLGYIPELPLIRAARKIFSS